MNYGGNIPKVARKLLQRNVSIGQVNYRVTRNFEIMAMGEGLR